MQQLVHTLPAGDRVVAYVVGLDPNAGGDDSLFAKFTRLPGFGYFGARVSTVHLLSRACIGHCFDYMNYEPSSGQFRIRAKPGNLAVVANPADSDLMEKGSYVVRATDLPLSVIVRCGPGPTDLCLRPLVEGQSSAMLAYPGGAGR